MTYTLPEVGPLGSAGSEGAAPGQPYLDEDTKQLVRKIVWDGYADAGTGPDEPIDWESVWRLARHWPSEALALGSAVLAAREVNGGQRPLGPSSVLASPEPAGRAGSTEVMHNRVVRQQMPKRLQRALTGATWVRNVGLIIVLFAIWQLWGTGFAEAHSQNQLQSAYAQLVKQDAGGARLSSDASTIASAGPERAATTAFSEPALPGGVIGQIRIPAIGVQKYFVEGVGEPQLQEGPGRYPGSGLPGQVGNLAIAGHRTTYGAPFFRLGDLKVGDKVIIDVPQGRATYVVSQSPFAVSPWDVNVLADYGDARVTLTTCNPPFFATTRLIVVAKLSQWLPTGSLVPVPVAPTSRPRVVTPGISLAADRLPLTGATSSGPRISLTYAHLEARPATPGASADRPGPAAHSKKSKSTSSSTLEAGLADEGSGWKLSQLPLAMGVIAGLCVFGTLYRRLARLCAGASRWLVMVPMWAAGLLALFKVLGLLLPADL